MAVSREDLTRHFENLSDEELLQRLRSGTLTPLATEVATAVWFMAFEKIADDIAMNARKGDQLIVTARVRLWYWSVKQGEKHGESEFIVTGFRYGAKKGGPGAIGAAVFCYPSLWHTTPSVASEHPAELIGFPISRPSPLVALVLN